MQQLHIRYPDKTGDETRRICNEVAENWNKYRSSLGEFWLAKLDTPKRQAIIGIAWSNVQKIIKQIWTLDGSVEHLSITRHLAKLQQRLLANNGQCLWDICQNKHKYVERELALFPPLVVFCGSSWTTSLMSHTHRLSPIELSCCNRFVELCKQALFVVYRYSVDDKTGKQRQQPTEGTTVAVIG